MTTTQEVLNKELEEIITARCGRVYTRRLIKDLEDLLPEHTNYKVHFDYRLEVPVIVIQVGEDEYTITLSKSFPFKCPQLITVNGAPYSSILVCHDPNRKKLLKELTGLDCLCCRSVMCEGNWTIQTRLKGVVNEIKESIDINKQIDNFIINNCNDNDIANDNDNDDIKNLPLNDPNKKRKIH